MPGKILGRLDGRLHPLHGEEGGEVGGVGADHDEGEEPPHASHHPGGDGPGGTDDRLIESCEARKVCLFPVTRKVDLCEILLPPCTRRSDSEKYHSLLGRDVTALLHEGPDGEPHGVAERELVDEHLLLVAGVRVVPLVRAEPGAAGREILIVNYLNFCHLARMKRSSETMK